MKCCRHAAEGVVDEAAHKIKRSAFGPVGAAFASSDAEGSTGSRNGKKMIGRATARGIEGGLGPH
jgi:hypothetical protein